MKKLFKTLVFALTLALTLNASAADGIAVTVNEDFQVKVEYTNAIDGERLYSEYAGSVANDSKTLSLEELPVGKYYLIYEDDYAKSYTTIKKEFKGLDIVKDESKTIFKPNYRVENDIVMISFTNPKEVKTTTRVYDESGAIIESMSDHNLVVKQALNFEELPAGNYRIGVSIGKDYFSKQIAIK